MKFFLILSFFSLALSTSSFHLKRKATNSSSFILRDTIPLPEDDAISGLRKFIDYPPFGYCPRQILGAWVQTEAFTTFSYGLSTLSINDYDFLISLKDSNDDSITFPIFSLKNANWARIDGELLGHLLLKLVKESPNPANFFKNPSNALSTGFSNSNLKIQFLHSNIFLDFPNNLWLFLSCDLMDTFSQSQMSLNNILSFYILLGDYLKDRPDHPLIPVYLLRANYIQNAITRQHFSHQRRKQERVQGIISNIQGILSSPIKKGKKFSKIFHLLSCNAQYSLDYFKYLNSIIISGRSFTFVNNFKIENHPKIVLSIQPFIADISHSPLTSKDACPNIFLLEFMQIQLPIITCLLPFSKELTLLSDRLTSSISSLYLEDGKHYLFYWINEIIKLSPKDHAIPFSFLGADMSNFVVKALDEMAKFSYILKNFADYHPTMVNLIFSGVAQTPSSTPLPSSSSRSTDCSASIKEMRKMMIKQAASGTRSPIALDINTVNPSDDEKQTIVARTVEYPFIHDNRMIIKWKTAMDLGGPSREWLCRLNEWLLERGGDILQSYKDIYHLPKNFLARDIGKLLGIILGKSFLLNIKPSFTLDPSFMLRVILPLNTPTEEELKALHDEMFMSDFRQIMEFKFYEPMNHFCTEEEYILMYKESFESDIYIARPEMVNFTTINGGKSNMAIGHHEYEDLSHCYKSIEELPWKERNGVILLYKEKSLEEFKAFIRCFREAFHSILDFSLIDLWISKNQYSKILLDPFSVNVMDESMLRGNVFSSIRWGGAAARFKDLFKILIEEVLHFNEIVRFIRLLTGLNVDLIVWGEEFRLKIEMKSLSISPLTTLGFIDESKDDDCASDSLATGVDDTTTINTSSNSDLLIDSSRFKEIVQEINTKMSLTLGEDIEDGVCNGGRVRLSKHCSCFLQFNLAYCADELEVLHTFLLSLNQSVDQMHH